MGWSSVYIPIELSLLQNEDSATKLKIENEFEVQGAINKTMQSTKISWSAAFINKLDPANNHGLSLTQSVLAVNQLVTTKNWN